MSQPFFIVNRSYCLSIDNIFYFSGMKIKGYSILLLISFLMILAHGFIPHHHHKNEFFHAGEKHVHSSELMHSHESEQAHHHDTCAEDSDGHDHTIPFHIHTSIVHGYDFLNIKTYSHIIVLIELPVFLNNEILLRLVPPPDFEDYKFTEYPLIIPPEPASVTALLRAPPVYA